MMELWFCICYYGNDGIFLIEFIEVQQIQKLMKSQLNFNGIQLIE